MILRTEPHHPADRSVSMTTVFTFPPPLCQNTFQFKTVGMWTVSGPITCDTGTRTTLCPLKLSPPSTVYKDGHLCLGQWSVGTGFPLMMAAVKHQLRFDEAPPPSDWTTCWPQQSRRFSRSEAALKAALHCWMYLRCVCRQRRSPAGWDHQHKVAADITHPDTGLLPQRPTLHSGGVGTDNYTPSTLLTESFSCCCNQLSRDQPTQLDK